MRTRVKICGLCRLDQALLAESLGVDAIGLNFAEGSPRRVELSRATEISEGLGPLVNRVGLFVNPTHEQVIQTIQSVRLDILQFHGEEAPDFCLSFGMPYIKAVRVQSSEDILTQDALHGGASALLLDSFHHSAKGGTGTTFDWALIPKIMRPIILAGGLNPENVRVAIAQVLPYAVDVSSGVESAPGFKDAAKMRAFVAGAGAA